MQSTKQKVNSEPLYLQKMREIKHKHIKTSNEQTLDRKMAVKKLLENGHGIHERQPGGCQ